MCMSMHTRVHAHVLIYMCSSCCPETHSVERLRALVVFPEDPGSASSTYMVAPNLPRDPKHSSDYYVYPPISRITAVCILLGSKSIY